LTPTKTARERVLEVATDLFYREGVRAVGIDTIVARSGVAKMSLYRNFPSKDDLVVAFLEDRNRRFFAWWDRVVGSAEGRGGSNPLRDLVTAVVEKVRRPEYRGCPFLNTSAEFPEAGHPARAVIAAHKAEVRSRLLRLARDLGAARPEVLTEQLIVLMDGVYAYPATFADPDAGAAVVAAADALIAAQVDR